MVAVAQPAPGARAMTIRALLAVTLVGLAAVPAIAQPVTATWNGTSGNWSNPALWSTNPYYPNNGNPPGVTYNATVNGTVTGAILTVDQPITIQALNFSSGTLPARGTISGSSPLTLNGPFTWSG